MKHPRTRATPAWAMLGVIIAASLLSILDRQLLSVLVADVRASLQVNDFQIGWLSGPVFVTCSIAGMLIGGWLADKHSRTLAIAASIACWSLATAASGLVAGLTTFAAARAMVGFFEGAATPSFHSLMADRFNAKRLPLALSIYSISNAVGPGLAILIGGLTVAHFTHAQTAWFSLAPWRLTFLAVGLPGILCAFLFLFLKVPTRPAAPVGSNAGLLEFWRLRKSLIILYISGIGLLFAAEFALLSWLPTLLSRRFELAQASIAWTLGAMFLAIGAIGSLFWGFIATNIFQNGRPHAALLTLIVAVAAIIPFTIAAPLMPTAMLTLALIAPIIFCKAAYVGLSHAVVQTITPSALRGRVAGIFMACSAVIAGFIGPTAIGLLTTYVFRDDQSVGLALSIVAGFAELAGLTLLILCVRPYRAQLALTAAQQTSI